MSDQNGNSDHSQTTGRRKRVWLIPIAIALLAIVAGFLWTGASWWDPRWPDERLAQIEAARVIPASENAATIYNELMRDPNGVPQMQGVSTLSNEQTHERVLYEAWLTKDYPELAAWVEKQQFIIDRLMNASKYEKCRFSVSIDAYDTKKIERLVAMYVWAELLGMAANNDVAEGRIDAAITKWRCLLQLANHLRQQSLLLDHLTANGVPQLAWPAIARLVVEGNLTETQLLAIEALPQPLTDIWARYLQEIHAVENLQERKLLIQYRPLQRVRFRLSSWSDHITGKGTQETCDEAATLYLSDIVMARTTRIFAALRRYKNATGHWPESLDDIKASLPAEVLLDPFNESPFIYRPQAGSFRLYSTGWNRIDESSQRDSEAGDDWPIWPMPKRETEKNHGLSKSEQ
jgi:hypothetical protein